MNGFFIYNNRTDAFLGIYSGNTTNKRRKIKRFFTKFDFKILDLPLIESNMFYE